MNKGNENRANVLKSKNNYIGGPFESLYLEKCTLPYSNYGILIALLYIFEAKRYDRKND